MKKALCFLTLLLLYVACMRTGHRKQMAQVSKAELERAVLVDVRTPEEFAAGHLEGAQNINWHDADFPDRIRDMGKEDTIYVYCRVGGRSAKAQAKLREMGYENVIDLTGGYEAWLQRESRP
ncbi:rhodanese-like domain-containing protein [Maribacter sp. 2307ULW6-5]|uniref:rhodanese-like domain-containing protein n=1 Tax=Maribacter sp. 2307ULW6-5 TaxID=3386275 RepID=UPI0039BD4FB7